MAVQEGPSFKRYAANGIATIYSIPFLLLDDEDLVVTLDGVQLTSGFTLAGIGNPTSTATFDVAPSGDLLFLLVIPFQRLADYQLNGDFLASTVNTDFDRLWLALKELRRDDQRALSVDPLEPEGIPPLPVAALRQSRVLAFDPDGNPIPSNLTLAQIEEQPALALASAQSASESAALASASETNAANSAAAAAASASFAGDPWFFQPLGVPIPVFDHITGVTVPPADNANYRYIKLTASDAYNTGFLTSESVSGSAPLVQATAVISVVGSPMNGQTVRLINTERRSVRAGSSGTVEADAVQGHGHTFAVDANPLNVGSLAPYSLAPGTNTGTAGTGGTAALRPTQNRSDVVGSPVPEGANGTPRTATETRSKNIGATYYMRVK